MLRSLQHINLRIAYRAPQRVSSILESFRTPISFPIMAKRKRSTVATATEAPEMRHTDVPLPSNVATNMPKPAHRQSSRGGKSAPTNPDTNPDVLDGVSALRASPDGHEDGALESHSAPDISNGTDALAPKSKQKKAAAPKVKVEPEESKAINRVAKNKVVPTENTGMANDPEAEEGLEEDEVEIKEALSRPPPVNSEYLPLPWKGRLGYVRITSVLHAVPSNKHTGLPQYVPSKREPSSVYLENVPYRKHNRASPSTKRPFSAGTPDKESTGQGTARRRC
jgi:hypothetical protein